MSQSGIFDAYAQALKPSSLLHVIDEEILQRLMLSFYYKHHAGMVLICAVEDAQGAIRYRRISPDPSNPMADEYFNPFCAEFRKNPKCNARCETCDLSAAQEIFKVAPSGKVKPYPCHVGIWDMTYGIEVGGRVIAVLFAGQKIIKDEIDSQDPKDPESIEAKIRQVVSDTSRAGDTGDVESLVSLAKASAEPRDVYDRFRAAFGILAQSIQHTVTALHSAKCEKVMHEALANANRFLANAALTSDADDGRESSDEAAPTTLLEVQQVVDGLSELLSNNPLWLLARHGSTYRTVAMSRDAANKCGGAVTFPVVSVVELPNDQWVSLKDGGKTQVLIEALRKRGAWMSTDAEFLRVKAPSPAQQSLSVILLVKHAIGHRYKPLVDSCTHALAYSSQMHWLFEKLSRQNRATMVRMAAVGHHLKTPFTVITNIADELEEIINTRVGRIDPEFLLKQARLICKRSKLALAEARSLQTAKVEARERVDLALLLRALDVDMKPLAEKRGVQDIVLQVDGSAMITTVVWAVPSLLRVAFSALLDNATKYSFPGRNVSITIGSVEEFDWALGVRTQAQVRVTISNIGPDFSPRKSTVSTEAPDATSGRNPWVPRDGVDIRNQRIGFGIGLDEATRIIEESGGAMEISCKRILKGSATQPVVFRTTVKVTLPITAS